MIRRITVPGATKLVGTVGERQVKVVASDATPDRAGDILEPAGVQLANFRRNPVVLWQHDAMQPIARCASIGVEGNAVVATVEFPPAGTSERADECLRLIKARVVGAVSVGFIPISWEPIRGAGRRYVSWELLELSCVSVPANPSALVVERAIAGLSDRQRQLETVRRLKAELSAPRRVTDAPVADRDRVAERKQHGLRRDPRVLVAEAEFRLRCW